MLPHTMYSGRPDGPLFEVNQGVTVAVYEMFSFFCPTALPTEHNRGTLWEMSGWLYWRFHQRCTPVLPAVPLSLAPPGQVSPKGRQPLPRIMTVLTIILLALHRVPRFVHSQNWMLRVGKRKHSGLQTFGGSLSTGITVAKILNRS